MIRRSTIITAIAGVLVLTVAAPAQIRITEWMYQGGNTIDGVGTADEFIEFTNVGLSPIDMTGWSFDDSSRAPGSQNLSAFGTVNPGESVVLADISESNFRTAWGLLPAIKVIGGNANNLGRGDELNLYDATSALIDRLTYDDQNIGGPRTQARSGNPTSLAALGANNPSLWVLASVGDGFGSYAAVAPATGDVANPGMFISVPEPGALALIGIAAMAGLVRRRRTGTPTCLPVTTPRF
jgi:predicted extracellular nuclease